MNGVDFWGNSEAIKPGGAGEDGDDPPPEIVTAKGGRGSRRARGPSWTGCCPRDAVALEEGTRFVFHAGRGRRAIDRITTLSAKKDKVVFQDTKEGMLGLRVARALEQPADKPEVFTDASGKPTPVPVLDNAGVTGLYTSSEGLKGDAVWGTRARWMALSGRVDDEDVVLLMLDHPKNPGHPTYWHARGYGLFAANPFGAEGLHGRQGGGVRLRDRGRGEPAVFRHRLASSRARSRPEKAEAAWKAFAAEPGK